MFKIEKYYREPLYRNSIAIILNAITGSLFGLLFWIVAARMIPPKDLGLATAIISVSMLLVSLSRFGLEEGLIRFLPTSKNKNEFFSSTLILTLLTSILLFAIFIIGVDFFSPALSFIREGYFPIMLIILISFLSLTGIQNTTLIILRRSGLSFIDNLLLGLRIPVLFFVASFGLVGIIFAFEVGYFVMFLFSLYIINRLGIKFKFSFKMESIKETILFSLGNYTASISSIIAVTVIPILIMNTIGAEDCAYYYIAFSLASILFAIPNAISTSLFVEGSHESPISENVLKSLKFVIVLLIPSIIGIFLFGDKILLLFGHEYSEQSFELLKLLAISSLFLTIISMYSAIKKVQKDIKAINCVNILFTILLLTTGYVLMLNFGLIGVGFAWIISTALISMGILLYMILYEKRLNEMKVLLN